MNVDANLDPPEARAARAGLVELVSEEVRDPRVLSALRRVPRHLFLGAPAPVEEAYGDHPVPIGLGQTISQPTVVGLMSEALELTGTENVLEIGTGSGYQAAVLGLLAREVDTIEVLPELARRSRAVLERLGFTNVFVHEGDGFRGLPEGAPYDRIVVTAAPDEIPEALLDQLADGGLLVVPVGPQDGAQRLERIRKNGARLDEEFLCGVRFVPMVHGAESSTPR